MRAPSRIILEAYHGRVYSLLDYLIRVSDTASHPVSDHQSQEDNARILRGYFLRDSDPDSYRDLLMNSILAEAGAKSNEKHGRVSLKITAPSSSMTEIIDRAHERLFALTRKPSNIITTGYCSAELKPEIGTASVGTSRHGVSNFFVNTLVTALQASDWCLLLKRVGDAILLHILTETSIYIALPNDCYCQVTGPPLIYAMPPPTLSRKRPFPPDRADDCAVPESTCPRKRKATNTDEGASTRLPKRRRRDQGSSSATTHDKPALSPIKNEGCPLTAIPIARTTMFYTRPQRRANLGHIQLGLPSDHILNRMDSRSWRVAKGLLDADGRMNDVRPADRDGALEARHFSKYVFPLRYRLDNVSSVRPERQQEDQFARFRFANRETEIEIKGSCKTPDRLKSVLPLLSQLYHRHTKCGYNALLNTVCPSKLRPAHKDESGDTSGILELISEEISEEELRTQMDYTMSDPTPISAGSRGLCPNTRSALSSKTQVQAKLRPKFAEFTCNIAEVYLFVCVITKEVIPHAFWGSHNNRKTVFSHVKQLLSGRRHESITLHSVMQGISTNECDWLLPSTKPSQRRNQSEAEMLMQRHLLQEFIFWYFDQFLLPLLKTTFYITDSSAYRNRILYFRQDDWDILCQPLVDRLAATTFQRIHQHKAEELLRGRKLGYSYVRLLPKDSGVRPIVNLRRKRNVASDGPVNQGQSINQILSASFQILGYEMTSQSEKLGASVFGPNEVYLRLKEFKRKITASSEKSPKLYFVKLDVQACFDTIEQDKLLRILKQLITEDTYMIQKYGSISPSVGKVHRKYFKKAIPDYEHPHFLTYSTQLAALLRHAILVDQVVYPFAFRDEIIQLLEDHITSNIVKIGNDYYRQRVGIPQGSVLSSLLCSFFYGDLERNVLSFVMDAERENVLLRLIDDYLFITTDKEEARRFLEVMNEGHPEYGCFIAREKTLTNFLHNVGDISQHSLSTVMHPDRKLFPWCGYLINMDDLSVMADYSRFHSTYLTDSLTIERSRRPNSAFIQKMLQNAAAKVHSIFIDTTHNTSRAVRVNVYQSFVLTAMKMHAYLRVIRNDAGRLAFVPRIGSSSHIPNELSNENEMESGPAKGKKRSLKERKEDRRTGGFLLHVIHQCIDYAYASIRNKVSSRLSRDSGGRCDVSKDEVIWLGTHAFHSILSIKRTAYSQAGVLSALQGELAHTRFLPIKRRLARLARESLGAMLRDIEF